MTNKEWHIVFSSKAKKDLGKLDHHAQKRIRNFLRNKLLTQKTPRDLGKPLSGVLTGCWGYRIGDYRLICEFQNDTIIIYALSIGHRKEIYKFSN